MQKKIKPSNAAFMWDNLVVTEYSSGCLRNILLDSKGVRDDIPKIYMEVGKVHEDQHEKMIQGDENVIVYARELEVKIPVPGYEDVLYSGRIDFLCNYIQAGKVVHETKGTISKNTRSKVIRKGEVKINQLAQLISYMIHVRTVRGKLICGYYELDNNVLKLQEERTFRVVIDDSGLIFIDGQPTSYTVGQQLKHRNTAAEVVSKDIIWSRPDKADQKYGSPCNNCVFKPTCDKYDAGMLPTVEEFIRSAQLDIDNKVVKPDPLPNQVKVRKTKKEK
jgi:hypothetical protein